MWLTTAASETIAVGSPVGIDGSAPGFVSTWAYTDASVETDTLLSMVGMCMLGVTGVASKYKMVLVRWK